MLFWAGTSKRVYNATLPHVILDRVFGDEAFDGFFSPANILRKIYSIVAFTLVGFVVDKALPPIHRRALRAALIVGTFSAAIETTQILRHAREGPLTHVFDIGCGALGGWLGVTLQRLRPRRRTR